MTTCESTDFVYPLIADVFYPIVDQGVGYGNVSKSWVLDKSLACSFVVAGTKTKEDVKPETNIVIDNAIVGRFRTDVTQSTRGELYSLTNILIANIRDSQGNVIYNESAGPRAGQSTLFEVATMTPAVGPFGKIDYYKVVLRRSENQATNL
jgi:hypothetical protein